MISVYDTIRKIYLKEESRKVAREPCPCEVVHTEVISSLLPSGPWKEESIVFEKSGRGSEWKVCEGEGVVFSPVS